MAPLNQMLIIFCSKGKKKTEKVWKEITRVQEIIAQTIISILSMV